MILSDLSWNIRGTLDRKFLALAKQYDNVVDFTLGAGIRAAGDCPGCR